MGAIGIAIGFLPWLGHSKAYFELCILYSVFCLWLWVWHTAARYSVRLVAHVEE